ncbi:hypothetical protein EDB84DRAFT_1573248 [Lactarius hengduanensis]|nr:hypothetical protein EDB84DRAFT_1573248 [Lactarius hengduanensis]
MTRPRAIPTATVPTRPSIIHFLPSVSKPPPRQHPRHEFPQTLNRLSLSSSSILSSSTSQPEFVHVEYYFNELNEFDQLFARDDQLVYLVYSHLVFHPDYPSFNI